MANQDQVRFGPIDGKVITISPDVVYSQTGTYYEIEVELKAQKFTSSTMEYVLVPGIAVQVFILTGSPRIYMCLFLNDLNRRETELFQIILCTIS